MKAMLKILAVAALIATNNAVFVKYSESAIKMYSGADARARPSIVEVINSDREFKFHLHTAERLEGGAFLYPDILPDSAHGVGHSICGNDLGINVADVATFCNASYFHVSIETFEEDSYDVGIGYDTEDSSDAEDKEVMHFSIYFKSDVTSECLLDIPVYKIPPTVDTSNRNFIFEEWAELNELGLLSWDDIQKLKAVRPNHGLTTDFKWLSSVLKYGVFKPEGGESTDTQKKFISRPIILPENEMQDLKAWITAVSSN